MHVLTESTTWLSVDKEAVGFIWIRNMGVYMDQEVHSRSVFCPDRLEELQESQELWD